MLKNCQARNRLCRFIVPPIECAHGMAADATKFISPAKILLMDKTLAVVMVIILWFFEFVQLESYSFTRHAICIAYCVAAADQEGGLFWR